jgi:glycolate oxidase FAD binding subunit
MDTNIADNDDGARLTDEIASAIATKRPVRICGGDSKAFLGRPTEGTRVDTRTHRGIVTYDPTELVITVRAGTPVSVMEAVLDAAGQMLPSEAPTFNGRATVGGMVATGLSGPRRPWSGSVRDFILGCRVITGQGQHLRFGGQVMKNVAGYDVSRLLTGSYGALGLISEVSLKVVPKPRATLSIALETTADLVTGMIGKWRHEGVPISGACHVHDRLYVRLEGAEGSVAAARQRIGGELVGPDFWTALREFALPLFNDLRPLWRLSLPGSAPHLVLPGSAAIDWGGAQRWWKTDESEGVIRELAQRYGGHATCFTAGITEAPFHPLPPSLMKLHQRLKRELDPHGIFNPGRVYAGL